MCSLSAPARRIPSPPRQPLTSAASGVKAANTVFSSTSYTARMLSAPVMGVDSRNAAVVGPRPGPDFQREAGYRDDAVEQSSGMPNRPP